MRTASRLSKGGLKDVSDTAAKDTISIGSGDREAERTAWGWRFIDNEEVYSFIRAVVGNKHLVAGICNGVDELDNAGILEGIESTHSVKEALIVGEYVITARANMYVDMAIAIGKKMNLFADEEDLQETIDFWKLHKTFS